MQQKAFTSPEGKHLWKCQGADNKGPMCCWACHQRELLWNNPFSVRDTHGPCGYDLKSCHLFRRSEWFWSALKETRKKRSTGALILFGGENRQDVSKCPSRSSSAWQEGWLCWPMGQAGKMGSCLQKLQTLNLQKSRVNVGNTDMSIFIIQIFSTIVFFNYCVVWIILWTKNLQKLQVREEETSVRSGEGFLFSF